MQLCEVLQRRLGNVSDAATKIGLLLQDADDVPVLDLAQALVAIDAIVGQLDTLHEKLAGQGGAGPDDVPVELPDAPWCDALGATAAF